MWGAWLGPSQALATSQPQVASPRAPVHPALQGGSGGSARSHQPGLDPVSVGRLQTRPEGTGPHGDLWLTAQSAEHGHIPGGSWKRLTTLFSGVLKKAAAIELYSPSAQKSCKVRKENRPVGHSVQASTASGTKHTTGGVRLLSWRGGRTQEPDPGPVRASEAIRPGRGCMASLSLGHVGIQRLTFGARSHSSLGRLWAPVGLDQGRGSTQSCVGQPHSPTRASHAPQTHICDRPVSTHSTPTGNQQPLSALDVSHKQKPHDVWPLLSGFFHSAVFARFICVGARVRAPTLPTTEETHCVDGPRRVHLLVTDGHRGCGELCRGKRVHVSFCLQAHNPTSAVPLQNLSGRCSERTGVRPQADVAPTHVWEDSPCPCPGRLPGGDRTRSSPAGAGNPGTNKSARRRPWP